MKSHLLRTSDLFSCDDSESYCMFGSHHVERTPVTGNHMNVPYHPTPPQNPSRHTQTKMDMLYNFAPSPLQDIWLYEASSHAAFSRTPLRGLERGGGNSQSLFISGPLRKIVQTYKYFFPTPTPTPISTCSKLLMVPCCPVGPTTLKCTMLGYAVGLQYLLNE